MMLGRISAALCLLLGIAHAAGAESDLTLRAASDFEPVAATTFDEAGAPVGESSFAVETDDQGRQVMHVTLAIEGGGTNVSQATLAPLDSERTRGGGLPAVSAAPRSYRLLEQRSQATRADGVALPLLVIDHQKRRVSCYPASEAGASRPSGGQHVDLPDDDRVVNVPMQLLFQPLVRGEVDSLRFQIAMCTKGPVIHDVIAVRGPTRMRDGRRVVEIRYGPDFGKAVAWLASRVLPVFSFWFDANDGRYLGHRMPLHRKGPEVLLVRQGLTPPQLGID